LATKNKNIWTFVFEDFFGVWLSHEYFWLMSLGDEEVSRSMLAERWKSRFSTKQRSFAQNNNGHPRLGTKQ